jgi:hypothetical protein
LQKIGSTDEIKLLVNAALFFERENQKKGKISDCIIKSQKEMAERAKQAKCVGEMKSGKIKIRFMDYGENKE